MAGFAATDVISVLAEDISPVSITWIEVAMLESLEGQGDCDYERVKRKTVVQKRSRHRPRKAFRLPASAVFNDGRFQDRRGIVIIDFGSNSSS